MDKKEFLEELLKLNIKISDNQIEQLEQYYNLIIEWNEKINLTRITEQNDVYLKHFYDSLTLCKVVNLNEVKTLCDIGTGAGFPGLVIKILFPNLKVTLVDSLNKRIEFLKTVIKELNLKDIEAIHARAEEFAQINREKYDIVTSRAVAPLNILLEYNIPLLKENKYFVAYKGIISQEIINSAHALKELNAKVEKIEEFLLPIEQSNRTLILIKKEKKTNKKYPRKNVDIKKKPL